MDGIPIENGVQQVSKKLPMNAWQFAEAARGGHNGTYLDEAPNGSPDDPIVLQRHFSQEDFLFIVPQGDDIHAARERRRFQDFFTGRGASKTLHDTICHTPNFLYLCIVNCINL